MNDARPVPAALVVDGRVTLARDDVRVTMEAAGGEIVLHAPDPRALWALLSTGGGRAPWRGAAARAHALLDGCGLSLRVRVRSLPLVRLGRGARPTLPARLAGLPGLQLGWAGLLALGAVSLGRMRRHGRT